jgi:hypothetical protein
MYPPDNNDPMGIFLFEKACSVHSKRVGITPDVHQENRVAAKDSCNTVPGMEAPNRSNVGRKGILVEDGPEQPEPVILPLIE